MNKTEFLKQAKAKYKEAVEKKWVAEMNFIFSDNLVLRVWFEQIQREGDRGEFMHRWCTVESLPCQSDKDIISKLSECISNEEVVEKKIIEFLRNATESELDEMAHLYEFELIKGKPIEISMWQPLEHFTLRMLAEHIGL